MTKAKEKPKAIVVKPLKLQRTEIEIENREGSSFLSQRLEEKAKQAISKKKDESGVAEVIPFKTIEEEVESKLHRNKEKQVCFPKAGFTGGMQLCAKDVGLTAALVKRGIRIIGPDLIPLKTGKIEINHSWPSGYGKTPRACVRPEIFSWSANLKIEFNESILSLNTLIQLISTTGFEAGIGSWAPHCPKGGDHGMYKIKLNEERK